MGIGIFGSGSRKTTKVTEVDTTTLGGQAQAQDATAVVGTQLGAGASLTILDQGIVKAGLDVVRSSSDRQAESYGRGLDFAGASGARESAAYRDSLAAFNTLAGKAFSGFESALESTRKAYGGAQDSIADASARVASAYEKRATLDGAVDADNLLRYVLLGAGVLIAGGLFVFTKGR